MDKINALEKKVKEAIDFINKLKEETATLQAVLDKKDKETKTLKRDYTELKTTNESYKKAIKNQKEIQERLSLLLEKVNNYLKKRG